MITISNTCGTAKVFTETLDSGAEGLLRALCGTVLAENSTIRVMPDVHAGKGCAVGTTMTYADKIAPGLVGVDIGCGVSVVKVTCKRPELSKLDRVIHERVPAGRSVRAEAHRFANSARLAELRVSRHVRTDKALLALGTLGGGNHFIELDKSESGAKNEFWLLVHSGSRHLGVEVEKHYHDLAFEATATEMPYELAYLSGGAMDDYLHDMKIVQEYASLNRKAIIDEIVRAMKMDEIDHIESFHNYVDTEKRILRKGAISAQAGERLVIPMNMRDGALMGIGKGNADWNFSAPHGAGRLKSRAETLSSVTVSQYKKTMKRTYTTCVSHATLDESPMAYKPMQSIVEQIEPTVEVTERIVPVYNFKAGADD